VSAVISCSGESPPVSNCNANVGIQVPSPIETKCVSGCQYVAPVYSKGEENNAGAIERYARYPGYPNTWTGDVTFAVSGGPFAFSANGVAADAELPTIETSPLTTPSVAFQRPIPGYPSQMHVVYDVPGGPYDWTSGLPIMKVGHGTWMWNEPNQEDDAPAQATGSNNGAQQSDSTRVFISGLAGATGASAAIGAVTEALRGRRKTSPREPEVET
jgi:hypothetical protein